MTDRPAEQSGRSSVGVGAWDWDLTTGVLTWDDSLLMLFGLGDLGRDHTLDDFSAALHPDDRDRVGDVLQAAVVTCGTFEAEFRVVRHDGTLVWVATRGRALAGDAGTAVRVLGAAWDVDAVRADSTRSVRILETMSAGFYSLDREWRFTYVNAPAEALIGVTRAEAVGHDIWDLFPAARDSTIGQTYRQVVSSGQPATFDAYYPAPLNAWFEIRVWPADGGLSVFFLDITERHQLQTRNELLLQVTRDLTGTLDAEVAVGRLARLLVPEIADWCMVSLVDDEQHGNFRRDLRDVGYWHADPAARSTLERYARVRIPALTDDSFLARALHTEQTVLLERDATDRMLGVLAAGEAAQVISELAPEFIAFLPTRGLDSVNGVITLGNGSGRGPMSTHDLTVATDIAARAGQALDNARLYRQQLGLAEGLQRSLLSPPPQPDHAQVAVRYVPAARSAQVGGDWYDGFFQPGGAMMLVIGDVAGHDTQAAADMGQIRTILRTVAAQSTHGPAAVLSRTDEVMETLMVGTVSTAAVVRLERTPDELERGITRVRWSNAGHPPPFVIDADGRVYPLLLSRADLLLGVDPTTPRREAEVALHSGSVVVLYTDGLVERRDHHLDHGLQRLQDTLESLAHHDLDELCDQLLARMLPDAPGDDVALVAVHLHPPAHTRPSGG